MASTTRTRPATPDDGVTWITGGSSGIGAAVAAALAARGGTVAVTARDAAALDAVAAAAPPGRIVAVPGDVTDAAAMAAAVARIEREVGSIAVALLNAGVYLPVDGRDPDPALFAASFAVNLGGTVNALLPALAAMKPRRHGRLVIVSSVAGYRGLPTSAAYGATKAALINLAESLKFDLDGLGIHVQVVSPGFVDTPATRANPFPMPHLMSVEAAAARLVAGLHSRRFEVTFPRRFTWQLKLLRLLPDALYFPLVARATGWSARGRGRPPTG